MHFLVFFLYVGANRFIRKSRKGNSGAAVRYGVFLNEPTNPWLREFAGSYSTAFKSSRKINKKADICSRKPHCLVACSSTVQSIYHLEARVVMSVATRGGGGTKLLFSAGPSSGQESKSALANLPSFDSKNFSKFLPSSACRSGGGKRPSVYLPLNDQPHTQVITSEKTNILLR